MRLIFVLLVMTAIYYSYKAVIITRNAFVVSHLHEGDYVTKRLIGKDEATGQVVEIYQRERDSLREHPVQSCGFVSIGMPFVIGASTVSKFVSAPKHWNDWARLSVRPETFCRYVVSMNFIGTGILYEEQYKNPNASAE
ncbi:hypothetical protein [Gluconobacter kondonii]|uniref:hypothetical protein n=1 Tax=Gluconobacter kondonii TaxID=941463 RepID=UPI001B8D1A8E|nr:hypothetical protein [Gluconobacter kondonii]MBS1054758.1 hypothetical protein [Gluconobacter kondonii]